MSLVTIRALVTGWLLLSAVAIHDRFRAMETGPALSPRFYHAAPAKPLGKRQSQCDSGHHPCNEIGSVGSTACCPDDSYCIVNTTNTDRAACCRIGSTCNSPCSEEQFQCDASVTVTANGATSTSIATACCSRVCTQTSMFGCPASLGGGCCSYGSSCGTSQCFSTVTPSTSSSPLVSQVPSGCTTSQISCASSLGGGCCAVTQTCTLVSNSPHCADTITTPSASGVSLVEDKSGLTAGATAGISVGAVVGCGLLIGAATWWCLRRRGRKGRRTEETTSTRQEPWPNGVVGVPPPRIGRETSDDASDAISRREPLPGLAQDYFGPDPAIGPFSDTPDASVGTTPADRDRGGVPVQPHVPADIAVPVEIDSRVPWPPPSSSTEPVSRAASIPPPPRADGAAEERFELYGSDLADLSAPNLPSPLTPATRTPLDETPSEVGGEAKRHPGA